MDNFKDHKEFYEENFNRLVKTSELLTSMVFEDCIFNECDLSETSFYKCKFVDCQFIKCNLSLINVDKSNFFDLVFEECKMIGIDWTKASWPHIALQSPVKFYKSILNDSSFFGLNLVEIVIEECKAHNLDLREGNFKRSNFTYTDFTDSYFNNTNLSYADFTEASNYNIDLLLNKIKNAKFSRFEAINLLNSFEIELVD